MKKTFVILAILLGLVLVFFPYDIFDEFSLFGYTIEINRYKDFATFIGGILGTGFAGIAVILIYKTYVLQSQELKATKGLLNEQKFEQKFFQMLGIQNDIRNGIKYVDAGKTYLGIDFFIYMNEGLKTSYETMTEFRDNPEELKHENNTFHSKFKQFKSLSSEKDYTLAVYLAEFELTHYVLGHYFRHLYHILKFIDKQFRVELSKASKQNKHIVFEKYKNYADIVQAQLSSSELAVLFYNGLAFTKMKALIHKFKFLDNLATEDLIKAEHTEFYSTCEIFGEKYKTCNFQSRSRLVYV